MHETRSNANRTDDDRALSTCMCFSQSPSRRDWRRQDDNGSITRSPDAWSQNRGCRYHDHVGRRRRIPVCRNRHDDFDKAIDGTITCAPEAFDKPDSSIIEHDRIAFTDDTADEAAGRPLADPHASLYKIFRFLDRLSLVHGTFLGEHNHAIECIHCQGCFVVAEGMICEHLGGSVPPFRNPAAHQLPRSSHSILYMIQVVELGLDHVGIKLGVEASMLAERFLDEADVRHRRRCTQTRV